MGINPVSSCHVETCVLLVRESISDDEMVFIKVDLDGIALDQSRYVPPAKPTYKNIKQWILDKYASQIPWQLDDDMSAMLPVMQTDIMLSHGEKTLIIDAKYYAHSTQIQYDKHSLHSGNLYQIFTYVKNKEAELADRPHEVSGMLLYAKTDEDIYPENAYRMSGNRIEVRTLNLDGDFDSIKSQLDGIAEKYFGIKAA